jgi:hypothetical protein
VETNYSALLARLREKKAIDDALRADISAAIDAYKEGFVGKEAPAVKEAAEEKAAPAEKKTPAETAAH